jgi:hypothetical protein
VKKSSVETQLIADAVLFPVSNWWIPDSIPKLSEKSFEECKAIELLSFESNSRLTRIESFALSSLRSLEIPRNVEILGSACFLLCKSLSSTSFEPNSRLTRIESDTFASSSLQSIEIP